MKVVIGCDFSAIEFKKQIISYLQQQNYEVLDVGQKEGEEQLIYPEAAKRVARKIQNHEAEKGIILCGTGGGVSIAVNKFKGVYCVASESIFTAFKMSQINGANVLAMGKNVVGEQNAYGTVRHFLTTPFCCDFTPERTEFITGLRARMVEIEEENMK